MVMLSRFIAKVEAAHVSFGQWAAGFLGIIFIRFFLENLSSPTPSFPAAPDMITLVHYGLFYLAALLLISLIIRIAVPDVAGISKFIISIFPISWLPPIIDIIRSKGFGTPMAYVFDSGTSLWARFLAIGGSSALGGITLGIKIELIIIVLGVLFYVRAKTKHWGKAFGIAVLSYLAIFFLIALPSFIALPAGTPSPSSFLISIFSSSHMAQNFVRPTVQFSYGYAVETVFNLGMAQFLFLLDFALMGGWLFLYKKSAAINFLKNIRPGRVIHFAIMAIGGGLLAASMQKIYFFNNWSDGMAFAGLIVSYICAWLFAVGINDLADISIDAISNSGRPLITGALSEKEMRAGIIFFLTWSLLGAFLAGYWALFLIGTFTAAYYVYSAPPARLKRIPILATFLISIACLSAAMAGFYFVSGTKVLSAFPLQILLLIIVFFTLFLNVKDLKDIEGDRAGGIPTVPVIFGRVRGKMAVGALAALAFFTVPVFLGSWVLFIPSLIAAAVTYFLIVSEPYHEWKIFIFYFAYLATIGTVVWIR